MKYTKAQFLWGTGGSDKFTFPLNAINSTSPYVVKSITGLEPPPIDVSIGDKAFEGGIYQGRRPQNREIVVTLGFQPNYAIGEDVGTLRTALNVLLNPKLDALLRFRLLNEAETEWVQTSGHIKRMEQNPFSKDPEIQITMPCTSPYFENAASFLASPGALSGLSTFTITNLGDAPTGFFLVLVLNTNINPFKISNSNNSKWMQFNYAFLNGDRIWIDTRAGQRSVKRTRSSVDLNLLPLMTEDSSWLQLDGGATVLDPNTNSYTVEQVAFSSRWWGF